MNCIFMFYFNSYCYRGAITVIEDFRLSVFIVRHHEVSSLWIANWMIFLHEYSMLCFVSVVNILEYSYRTK